MVTELTGGKHFLAITVVHRQLNCDCNKPQQPYRCPTVSLPKPFILHLRSDNYLLSSIRLRTVATFFDIFIRPPNNYNKNGLRGSKAIRNSLLLHHHSLWSDRLDLWLFPPRFYIRFLFMGSRSGDQYSIMRPRLANLQQTPCQVAGKHPR